MAQRSLLVEVRFLDERYHGEGDWPPCPFRLFQALVAAAYGGRWIAEEGTEKDTALTWLEQLSPPVIVAPHAYHGQPVRYYVPNNDLDAVAGDMARVGEIRTLKLNTPQLLAHDSSFLYLWRFDDSQEPQARTVVTLLKRMHHLGRGLDAAFAQANIVPVSAAEEIILHHGGLIHRPSDSRSGQLTLRCPGPGSLTSLKLRHQQQMSRFVAGAFRQPEPSRFRLCSYDSPPVDLLFDFVTREGFKFSPIPLRDACSVALAVREAVAERLTQSFPDRRAEVARVVNGRGADDSDRNRRLVFVPIPSIGFVHADRDIRRMLVRVPADCPFSVDDIAWAIAGAQAGNVTLTASEDKNMLEHYGLYGGGANRWQTVTPALIAGPHLRRRMGGNARARAEQRVIDLLHNALRHSALPTSHVEISIQREPFERQGLPANMFSKPPYLVERLAYHVELAFPSPLRGPVIIGDGRFLGIGLMAPAR